MDHRETKLVLGIFSDTKYVFGAQGHVTNGSYVDSHTDVRRSARLRVLNMPWM